MARDKAVDRALADLVRDFAEQMPEPQILDDDEVYELARWLSTRCLPIDAADAGD